MVSLMHSINAWLCFMGLAGGLLSIASVSRSLQRNEHSALRGDTSASKHIILPCYKLLLYSIAALFSLLLCVIVGVYYAAMISLIDGEDVTLCSFCCVSFLLLPYCSSPLLLWVVSLSRRGFRKVIVFLLPFTLIFFLSLVALSITKARQTRQMMVFPLMLLVTCGPALAVSVALLSKKMPSRLEIRSGSSRSSTMYLLIYGILVLCSGTFYSADSSSVIAVTGLGVTASLNIIYPYALNRTFLADTKYWRGLGKFNQGGIGPLLESSVNSLEVVSMRVAATHLQCVLDDLGDLMIDFSSVRLGAWIGSGATSSVYNAEYKSEKIVIKVFSPPEITEEELLSLRKETLINASMTHPCIVRTIGICVRPPSIGILMEYCKKGTLKSSLLSHSVEWTRLRRLNAVADLARAVAYVHSKGFLHRDIKSDNIFVTEKWKVKLGDFGESREMLRSSQAEGNIESDAQRMTVLGTVAYMAPELVNATRHYTEAIDIYAMAITFWEIWTGSDPFEGETIFSLYSLISRGSRPGIPPSCPSDLARIIVRCWSMNPRDRPSARDVVEEMEVFLNKMEKEKDSLNSQHVGNDFQYSDTYSGADLGSFSNPLKA